MKRLSIFAAGGLAVLALVALPPAHGVPDSRSASPMTSRSGGQVDGGAGPADLCPDTPRDARPVIAGCAAVQIVRRPDVLTGPTVAAIEEMRAALQDAPPLDHVQRRLLKAAEHVASSKAELAQGDTCKAARSYDQATAQLSDAREEMDRGVATLARDLVAFDPRAHDASAGDVTVAFLRMLGGRLGKVVDTGTAAADTINVLCRQAAGKLHERARVVDVDDGAGLIRLDNGRVLAISPSLGGKHTSVHEGSRVVVKGSLFSDGTGVLSDAASDQPTGFHGSVATAPCMALRVAPVQPFAPYHGGPFILHEPQAYRNDSGALELERGMRLAAVEEEGCPHSTDEGLSLRYGMKIEVIEDLVTQETIAFDLKEGDHPVAFPSGSSGKGTIKTTVFVTSCKQLANGTDDCSVAVEQNVKHHEEVLRPRGHFSTAVYSKTTFSVKDNNVAGDFDTVVAVGMDLTDIPLGANVQLVGTGYRVTGGVSSHPQLVDVKQGEQFAIYDQDDFIPDGDLLFELDMVGVDHEAGMAWPHIVGTRNGREFSYSSKLPQLLRDRVSSCPHPDDSWYRLPFYGGWPFWTVNTGNYGDPVHGHNESQAYAWDFNADLHTEVAAARGGKVVWVVEDETLNAKQYPKDPNDPSQVDPSYTKIGNFIWIRHDDGTVSAYLHLAFQGAHVAEGDIVHRGQHIGSVGNTGYSSAPHLHYEGGLVTLDWHDYTPSVVKLPVRFEALVGEPTFLEPTYTKKDCYIPKAGDLIQSTQ